MSGYSNFLIRMNAGGNTMRLEQIENARRMTETTFADDPSYVVEGCPIWYSDRVIHPRIYNYTYRSTQPFQASIQTLIDEPFYKGDILKWRDNGYWMCISTNDLHDINREGMLEYCNEWIKFKSPLDGSVRIYPVAMYNATQYGTGEEYRRLITEETASHIIHLTADEHTVLIEKSRFILDRNTKNPTVFRVTQNDTTSYDDGLGHGYLRLYVISDRYNERTDNIENMLADEREDKENNYSEVQDNPDMWI